MLQHGAPWCFVQGNRGQPREGERAEHRDGRADVPGVCRVTGGRQVESRSSPLPLQRLFICFYVQSNGDMSLKKKEIIIPYHN